MNSKNLTLKELPFEDRPYEKFIAYGAKYLTDAELLAIILRTGNRKSNCVELSQQLLRTKENGISGIRYLQEVSMEELKTIDGIGNVKAVQIKAVMELAKRISFEKQTSNAKITCPKDAYCCVKNIAENPVEELQVLILNNKNYVVMVYTIARGKLNQVNVSLKEVFNEPIKQLASSIILVHNHPSGDTTPSKADILLTSKIASYGYALDIVLQDHIIIGKNGYTSIRETNSNIFIKECELK